MQRIVFKTKDELAYRPQGKISAGEFLLRKKVLTGIEMCSIDYYAVNNLFSSLSGSQIDKLTNRAKANCPSYQVPDLFSYYTIECGLAVDQKKTLQNLRKKTMVEWAYLEKVSSIAPDVHTSEKPLACYQGYLYDAPLGIGADHAWRRKGGRGDSTIQFVDIEKGWLFDHESLNLQRIPNTGTIHESDSDHGAAVMGIITMKDGGSGAIGITPLVKGSVVSLYRPDGFFNTPDAILSAIAYLNAGDIMLLETQVADNDGYCLWPLEIHKANFDMISLATALGITVIEPAGNGNTHATSGNNLDEYKNWKGQKVLNRNDPDFKDSGAIMVSAATSDVPHERMRFTNYGSRIDCYAWGENILTAGLHPRSSGIAINTYTHQFGGTSGASAIVAGAAISFQSMMEANHHCRLVPSQMREIMGNPSYGTASSDVSFNDLIGVMPDLEKITRDYIDKFDQKEGIIPLKSHNIGISSVYDQAV